MPNRDGTGPRGNGRPGKDLVPADVLNEQTGVALAIGRAEDMDFTTAADVAATIPLQPFPPRKARNSISMNATTWKPAKPSWKSSCAG